MSLNTGIDLPSGLGIALRKCSIGEIIIATHEAYNLDFSELLEQTETLKKFALDHYSPSKFTRQFTNAVKSILKKDSNDFHINHLDFR